MSGLQRAIDSLPKPKNTGKIPAAKTFEILPQHFADSWENKPVAAIVLGIRVPSEKDVQGARIEAERAAANAAIDESESEMAQRITVFNDTLMCLAVASAICDPNDVTAPHPFFDMPDDMVPLAFPPKTIQHIFDLCEQLHVERSPTFPEITAEEEIRLHTILLTDDPYEGVNRVSAMKARRFLKFAIDLLEE